MKPNIDDSQVPRCQHIKADGIQCNNPAMKHQRFCYYHTQIERTFRKSTAPPQTVGVDTVAAIRIALTDVLNRIARGNIDHPDARLMLRGLQNATVLLKHDARSKLPRDVRIITDERALSPHVNPGADREGIGEHPDGTPALQQQLANALQDLRQRKAYAAGVASAQPTDHEPSPSPEATGESQAPAADQSSLTSEAATSTAPYPVDCEPTEDEIVEALTTEVKRNLPPRAPGEPATCLLVHNTYCEFAGLDSSIWTCPIHEAFNDKAAYVLPDLQPFLKDVEQAQRCESLAALATEFDHLHRPLCAGVRNPDHTLANA